MWTIEVSLSIYISLLLCRSVTFYFIQLYFIHFIQPIGKYVEWSYDLRAMCYSRPLRPVCLQKGVYCTTGGTRLTQWFFNSLGRLEFATKLAIRCALNLYVVLVNVQSNPQLFLFNKLWPTYLPNNNHRAVYTAIPDWWIPLYCSKVLNWKRTWLSKSKLQDYVKQK